MYLPDLASIQRFEPRHTHTSLVLRLKCRPFEPRGKHSPPLPHEPLAFRCTECTQTYAHMPFLVDVCLLLLSQKGLQFHNHCTVSPEQMWRLCKKLSSSVFKKHFVSLYFEVIITDLMTSWARGRQA